MIDGLYGKRRAECEESACKLGVSLSTDLATTTLRLGLGGLGANSAKRARHIVEENARIAEVGAALAHGDLAAAGRLHVASHRSSQYLLENSTTLRDTLVDRLGNEPGVHGARLTGGGFGGVVVTFTSEWFSATQAEATVR
ncbi:MAG: hypothetical protein KGR25_06485 [Chloroflexi bacterium]|nr:hypothetical protein [Chloroflexota bacterium]